MLRASQNRINLLAKDLHFTKKSKAKHGIQACRQGQGSLQMIFGFPFLQTGSQIPPLLRPTRGQKYSRRQPGQPPLPQLPSSSSSVGTKASEPHTLLDSLMQFKPVTPYPILVIPKSCKDRLNLFKRKSN